MAGRTVLMALVAALAGASLARPVVAGDRLILDPAPSDQAKPAQGATADDIERRVKELEDQKTQVNDKRVGRVSVDVSGSASSQVQAVRR